MGIICHHAIVITSYDKPALGEARLKAEELFNSITDVSEIIESGVNGYVSFLIAPDGSKEGWEHSEEGDHARDEFIAWIESKRYEDNSSCYSWAEIQYGNEVGPDELLRRS